MKIYLVFVVLNIAILSSFVNCTAIFPSIFNTRAVLEPTFRRQCPVCDSSVYSYCSDKLFHDSCCCHNPYHPYDTLPYECQYADCSFLHSNTCHEHKLISACCCTDSLYRF